MISYIKTYNIENTYDIVGKIYDIVGFWLFLANRMNDITYDIVYDIVGLTYYIVYDCVKNYDIVGLTPFLASRTLQCDLRYPAISSISHTIC